MLDYILNFLGAIIWGDLTLISSGTMVAVGIENLTGDFLSSLLGIFFHDLILFYLGRNYLSKVTYFKFFREKYESTDNKNNYERYKKNKFSELLWYKFVPNTYTGFPMYLGNQKENQKKFYIFSFLISLFFSTILFFFFYFLGSSIIKMDMFSNISEIVEGLNYENNDIQSSVMKIIGGLLSIIFYFLFSIFNRIFRYFSM